MAARARGKALRPSERQTPGAFERSDARKRLPAAERDAATGDGNARARERLDSAMGHAAGGRQHTRAGRGGRAGQRKPSGMRQRAGRAAATTRRKKKEQTHSTVKAINQPVFPAELLVAWVMLSP